MPAEPAHGASFRGSPICFDVTLVPQQRRLPLMSHSNAYVGSLRRQVATPALQQAFSLI